MTENDTSPPRNQPARMSPDRAPSATAERKERLARALRENLRRRKDQDRARDEQG
ncbi:MAG: hypothetical protein RLY86_2407 [Pseudomonadota bacterium]